MTSGERVGRRWLRGLAALAALVVVIAGAPVVLLSWQGPAGGQWWRADDGSLLLTVLVIAGWLAWLVFTLSTAAEAARFLSGNRFVVNLPLLGGLQALCAGLVLAVAALAIPATAPVAQAPTPADPAPVDGAAARTPPPVAGPSHPAPSGVHPPATPDAGPPRPDPAPPGEGYLVQPGDDLWSIAERLLGDGRRWRELVRSNPDTLSDPTRQLPAGTLLSVSVQRAEPERITVVRGDTLSGLALEHLGKAALWPRIAAANADLVADPDHIEVGWELVLPPAASPARAEPKDRSSAGGRPAASPPSEPEPGAAPPPPPEPRPPRRSVPVDPVPTPVPAPPDATAEAHETSPTEVEPGPDAALVGTLSALAAAGLMGGWQARRLLQHRARPPGRRVAQAGDELARFQAALGRHQAGHDAGTLDRALRAIGRHHYRTGATLPALAQVTLAPTRVIFQWAGPAGRPPAGFGGDPTAWTLGLGGDALPADEPWHPCPYPALVSLGTTPGGETVLVDVERSGTLGIAAETRELQLASLASIAIELGCAPWAAELSLVVVGGDPSLARTGVGEPAGWLPDTTAGIALLRQRCEARSLALAGVDLTELRVDPDRAEAVAPEVYVFRDSLTDAERELVDGLLAGTRLGIAAVLPAEADEAAWELFGDPVRPLGRLAGGDPLLAHAVGEATRAALEALYEVAESTATEAAPWWGDADAANVRHLPPREPSEDPVDVVNLRHLARPHPTLLLLGPVDLTGAAGPEPPRARQQLIEMASWLLEHPGRTATQMAAGLGIAESTRRSNMSRLRSWLGTDPDGQQYLPDAYTGRIALHPDVTSDVERLRVLTGPGVNRISEAGLVAALDLVRGDLLADAAPGQWFWADEFRSDISSTLRDAGLVLVDRALARRDVDLARWAAQRALVVAPDDELLRCARIRTEHLAGNRAAVERQVLRLTQQARSLGVDLLPETVLLCQQVMEGRTRARRA